MRRDRALRLGLLALGGLLVFLSLPLSAAKTSLFKLADPRGDDDGDGRLTYPGSSDYRKGDLDLLSLEALREADGTNFVATFARPVRQPGRGAFDELGTPADSVLRYGFYTLNLDIYIDIDRVAGSGGVALLPGRKAEVAPEFAWDRAICLTPRPNEARELLNRIVLNALQQSQAPPEEGEDQDGASRAELKKMVPADLESRVFFPSRVRVRGNTISFFVPDSFLGGAARADWAYVVAVSGADLHQSIDLKAAVGLGAEREQRLMILPIAPGQWSDRFGGGLENDPLQPPLVDVIVPAGSNQEKLLQDRSLRDNRPVQLPGVVPSPPAKAP